MAEETKNKICVACTKQFGITPEDFEFYKKINVPPPTFCPECRRRRRLAWMNLLNLYKRECHLCHKNYISMYSPNMPHIVYCPECWHSDKWDWREYGKNYDETKPFLKQFEELLRVTPLCGLSINTTTTVGSPYNNHAQDLKNCYLTFLSSYNENAAYGVLVTRNSDVFDCSMVMDCNACYDCMNIFKSSRCVGTRGNARFCLDCWFNRDCDNCTECIGCTNLRNKQYCIFNVQYSKEEYKTKKDAFHLDSWDGYKNLEHQAHEFWKTQPPKPAYDDYSVHCEGSYVFSSKDCSECFDVTGATSCKFMLMMYNEPTTDSYDISSWGANLSLSYEGNNIGENASHMYFTQESGMNALDIQYAKLVFSSSHVFGGVSVRNGTYVILNKEYSKEEFETLRKKIIVEMDTNPYTDKNGITYRYGEFFPIEIAPFPYNKTLAQLFYPMEENEIEASHLTYEPIEKNEYAITLTPNLIPDHIDDVPDSITNEIIACIKCGRGYRIIQSELEYLRNAHLPIPRMCPFCRIDEKFNLWMQNMHLYARTCGDCGNEFKTHYTEARAPIVLCKSCYQKKYI